MGQYYKPIILKEDKKTIVTYAHAHACDTGLKLMEHSYIDNSLCNAVYNYIQENGPCRLVWAGDYADPEKTETLTDEEIWDLWKKDVTNGLAVNSLIDYIDDYRAKEEKESEDGKTLYEMTEYAKEMEYNTNSNDCRFLINHDKQEFVDLWNVPCFGWNAVNPLSLLTAEGNQRGGGDYYGIGGEYVGTWARDLIEVSNKCPFETYTEIKPDFVEYYEIRQAAKRLVKFLPKYKEAKIADNGPAWDWSDEKYYGADQDAFHELKNTLTNVLKKSK